MAFLAQTTDEQQQQGGGGNQLPQVPLIPSLAGSGGPSAGSGGAGAQGTTNTASPGAAPSQPWANISSYLSANAPQSKQVADTISGNFNQTYNDIQNQAGQAEKNFTQNVGQNTVGLDQGMFNAAKSDPTTFAKDPNNVAAFQKAYNASYGGPANFEGTSDYADLQGKIQTAQKNAGLVGQGTTGIETLLQNTGKNATPGQNALDTLLLQENPDNFKNIASAAQPFSGLTDFLNGKVSSLDQAADAARTTTGNTASTLQNAFTGTGGVVPTFQNDFQSRLAAAQKSAGDNATKYQNDIATLNPALGQQELQSLNVGPEQWADLLNMENNLSQTYTPVPGNTSGGLNPRSPDQMNELMALYGNKIDLSPFLTTQDASAAINQNNFASPQEYAEAQALAQLTGTPSFLDQSMKDQATSYNPNLAAFGYNPALAAVQGKLSQNDQTVLQKTPLGIGSADPADKNFADFLSQIYTRNQGALNDTQKAWLARTNGGKTPSTPTTPSLPTVAPSNGDTRVNPNGSGFEYFNGTQWITSPPEFRNFQNGGYTEKFDFTTGKYVPTGWTGPTAPTPTNPGTSTGPGVFKMGGGSSGPGIY